MDTGAGQDGATPQLGRHLRLLAGKEIAFDSEDFFWEFDDWSEAAVRELAKEAGLETMTEDHWKVIHFLRDFYAYNGRAPLNNKLKKGTGLSLLELEGLFPGGLKFGARRLAGLPNPKSCG
ncbi:TusE/DsrC/DsvC family sulfur relay protein [Desulfoferula mesophila]|uniref:Sulfurtransferase TusE n=1 Tax=Desulfoferula mesophila TaxID=3058419 RepID=A0AAU9EQN1_9BACT|nr:sulfurtransferase TusE [Desulfoferula mesophilus]